MTLELIVPQSAPRSGRYLADHSRECDRGVSRGPVGPHSTVSSGGRIGTTDRQRHTERGTAILDRRLHDPWPVPPNAGSICDAVIRAAGVAAAHHREPMRRDHRPGPAGFQSGIVDSGPAGRANDRLSLTTTPEQSRSRR